MGVAVMTRTSGSPRIVGLGSVGRTASFLSDVESAPPCGVRNASFVRRFFHQLETLHDAEAMLFVDNHEPQSGELDALFDQSVGSDDELRIALPDVAADFSFAVFFHR